MKLTSILSACVLGLCLASCNDTTGLVPTVTAESEPNDTFGSADLIGSIGGGADPASLTCDVQFDDGLNTDLQDHFIGISTYTGSVLVEVTPTEPTADLRIIEELTSSTDGATINATGAGAAESGMLSVSKDQGFNFRVETTLADTSYTLTVTEVSPISLGSERDEPLVHQIVIDSETGQAQARTFELE